MTDLVNTDTWVFVAVLNPGGNEQFFGQVDEEKNTPYIPAFLGKEEAEKGFAELCRKKNLQYEVQAVLFGDLTEDAGRHGFAVYVLEGSGKLVVSFKPDAPETGRPEG
jgi:hypothetical protein